MQKTALLRVIIFCALGFGACKAGLKSESEQTPTSVQTPCDLLEAIEIHGIEKVTNEVTIKPIIYQGETRQVEECALELLEKIESHAKEDKSVNAYKLLEFMCINVDGSISEALGVVVLSLFEDDFNDFMNYCYSDKVSCLNRSLISEMIIRLPENDNIQKGKLKNVWVERINTFDPKNGQKVNLEALIKEVKAL